MQWQWISSWTAGENSLVHRCCQPNVGAGNDCRVGEYKSIPSGKGCSVPLTSESSLSADGDSWGSWLYPSNSPRPSFLLPLEIASPLSCHPLFILLPMTSHMVRLGNSHPWAVTSKFLSSNASRDVPLLSGAGRLSLFYAVSQHQRYIGLYSPAQLRLPVGDFLQSGVPIPQMLTLT